MITKSHRRTRKNTHLYAYLESTGILEKGTDAEIKAEKRKYKKMYLLGFMKRYRNERNEYTIIFPKQAEENKQLQKAAKGHRLSVTAFIKQAAIAYLNKTFLVTDKEQVNRMELMLSQFLNEVRQRKNLPYSEIEKRIESIEIKIDSMLRHPQEIISSASHDR